MNRGGLQGAAFELDDRFTGYDAATIAAMGFDGGKMLAVSISATPDRSRRSSRARAPSPNWPRGG